MDMNSGSGEGKSVVKDGRSEGMSLLVVRAGVAVSVGEGRRRVSCWQGTVREMLLSVRRRRRWRGREGDVGGDRAGVVGEDRSAGVAAIVGRLAGLQRRRCVGESGSGTRGAKEFVRVKPRSSVRTMRRKLLCEGEAWNWRKFQ